MNSSENLKLAEEQTQTNIENIRSSKAAAVSRVRADLEALFSAIEESISTFYDTKEAALMKLRDAIAREMAKTHEAVRHFVTAATCSAGQSSACHPVSRTAHPLTRPTQTAQMKKASELESSMTALISE